MVLHAPIVAAFTADSTSAARINRLFRSTGSKPRAAASFDASNYLGGRETTDETSAHTGARRAARAARERVRIRILDFDPQREPSRDDECAGNAPDHHDDRNHTHAGPQGGAPRP
jgi:hypothetical protein